MRYRLLALDVDGTLVDRRDKPSEATRDAVLRAREAGMQVVLATGRRYSRVLHLVEQLGLELPIVSASGALVKDPAGHRTLFRAEFKRELLREIITAAAEVEHEVVLFGDTYHERFDFYCRTSVPKQRELRDYLERNRGLWRACPQLASDPPGNIFAGASIGTEPQMRQVEAALARRMDGRLDMHVLLSPIYNVFMCEFAPAGISKWSAIERLAAESGISQEEVCAVGDDVNDLPMIRGAGLGIAMGNASQTVKDAADRVAPPQEEEGLAQVIDWLLNGA